MVLQPTIGFALIVHATEGRATFAMSFEAPIHLIFYFLAVAQLMINNSIFVFCQCGLPERFNSNNAQLGNLKRFEAFPMNTEHAASVSCMQGRFEKG